MIANATTNNARAKNSGGRLSIASLSKSFGDHDVLRTVTFDAAPGSVTVLLGPSGQGKTTMLRIIAGFERPDSGEVRLDDSVLCGPAVMLPPERRGIGYVPQDSALFPHLDVARNVGYGLPRGSRSRVDEMLELVGMQGHRHHRPAQLSGGQRQRVALARALAPAPRVVLMDEPFSALDASMRADVRDEAIAILRTSGATTLLVTHDQDEALALADHVVLVLDGEVAQADTPQRIYEHPASLAVARFIGQANLVDATCEAGVIRHPLGEHIGECRSGTVTVLIRPEHVLLVPPGEGVPGTVDRRSYFGHDGSLTVALDTGESVVARVATGDLAPVGARVHVRATAVSAVF